MNKLFIFCLVLLSVNAYSEDACTVGLKYQYDVLSSQEGELMVTKGLTLEEYRSVLEKVLKVKGYVLEDNGNSEYTLKLGFSNFYTEWDCFEYASYLELRNDQDKLVASGRKEMPMYYLFIKKYPSTRKLTLKAINRLARELPECR